MVKAENEYQGKGAFNDTEKDEEENTDNQIQVPKKTTYGITAEDSSWKSYNNTKSVKGEWATQLNAEGLRYIKDIARSSQSIDKIIESINEDY